MRGPVAVRRYRRGLRLAGLGVLVYVLVVTVTATDRFREMPPFVINREFYPAFNWSLFSRPTRYATRTTIVPLEVTPDSELAHRIGQPLDPSDAEFLRDIRFQKTGRRYVHAVDNGWNRSIRELEPLMAQFAATTGVTVFDVVQVLTDPLDRDSDAPGDMVQIETIGRDRE